MIGWWWTTTAFADPLSLDDAIAEALAHNPELRLEVLAAEDAAWAEVSAEATYDPVLRLGADTGASSSRTNEAIDGTDRVVFGWSGWSAAIDQRLPTGGTASLGWTESHTTSNSAAILATTTVNDDLSLAVTQPVLSGLNSPLRGVRNASLAADDAALGRRDATEQLVLDVSGAYWRLVSAKESLVLATRSAEIALQSLGETRERFEEGFAGSGDVHQVERALGVARQSEVIAADEVQAADASLCRILGRDVTVRLPIEPVDRPVVPDTSPSKEVVLASARTGNALWLRQQLAFEVAELGVRSVRDAALPDLSLTGQLGVSGLGEDPASARRDLMSGANDSWLVGASVAVPLAGRTLRSGLATARIERDAARIARDAAEQDLVLRVEAAVRAVGRDRARVTLAEDTVRFAQLALDDDQELLRDGKGATRDVVLSLESLAQAQADDLLARIDLQASLRELDRVAGTLVTPP